MISREATEFSFITYADDPEIQVIEVLLIALSRLDKETQARVLGYINDRLGL